MSLLCKGGIPVHAIGMGMESKYMAVAGSRPATEYYVLARAQSANSSGTYIHLPLTKQFVHSYLVLSKLGVASEALRGYTLPVIPGNIQTLLFVITVVPGHCL